MKKEGFSIVLFILVLGFGVAYALDSTAQFSPLGGEKNQLEIKQSTEEILKDPLEFYLENENSEEIFRGSLEILIFEDFENEQSWEEYYLVMEDKRYQIIFVFEDVFQDFIPGEEINVRGILIGDNTLLVLPENVEYSDLEMEDEESEKEVGGEISLAPAPIVKKVLVILYNFENQQEEPYTAEWADEKIFTGEYSSASFFQENSNKKIRIEGDVSGWFTIPYDLENSCDYYLWGKAARAKAKDSGIDLSKYDYIIHATGYSDPCRALGTAQVGGPYVWLFFDQSYFYSRVTTHELGHSIWLRHAHSFYCLEYGSQITLGRYTEDCEIWTYGDPFDTMGDSFNYHHFSNYQKRNLGTHTEEQIENVNENGLYNLQQMQNLPLGTKTLKFPVFINNVGFRSNLYYFLEYRQPFGLFDDFQEDNAVVQGISIRVAKNSGSVTQPILLDLNPADDWFFYDSTLKLGEIFYDEYRGVSIELVDLNEDNATVDIQFDKKLLPCGNLPSIDIEPSHQQGEAGDSLTYNFTIRNVDPSNCYPLLVKASFYSARNSGRQNQNGWYGDGVMTVDGMLPGEIRKSQIIVTSPENSPPGEYDLSFSMTAQNIFQWFGHYGGSRYGDLASIYEVIGE